MKNYKATSILILFIGLLQSCEGLFQEVTNEPLDNFNLFFQYLNEDYAYKDEHPFSMTDLETRYRPEMETNPTGGTLADIMVKIENDLLDPHVFIPFQAYGLSSVSRPDYFLQKSEDLRDFTYSFLLEIDIISSNNFFTYGITKDEPGVGYVRIENLSQNNGGQARLMGNEWRTEIETILQNLNARQVKSMIVDMRTSAGGSNFNGQYIANRFANRGADYMIESFDINNRQQEIRYNVNPEGRHHFREGTVILLTNNLTCSGGEFFTLAMKQRNNLVHIGTPTRGCAGSQVDRDLYNGWNIRFTSSKTFNADGQSYFKAGIQPDFLVANDPNYGLTTLEDKVIKKAIELLR